MRAILATLALLLVAFASSAQDDAVPLTAEAVQARWQGRLDAHRFSARVTLRMSLAGLEETRTLSVFRDDAERSHERVMIRFETPADLRNVAVLYLEHADRPNDYFLYQPATRRVRRLPASIADDDVYGIDLEFLGFGVAQSEPTRVEEVERTELRGRSVYRLVESALKDNRRFERRVTWIDAETFIPVKTEHWRNGRLVLTAESGDIREIHGVPTPTSMLFRKPREQREVKLRVEQIDYRSEIPRAAFSILNLTREHAGAVRGGGSR